MAKGEKKKGGEPEGNPGKASEEKVHVRKRKDEVWRVRELITVPDWGVLKLLFDGIPRSNSQIYSALGKQFTRKTLIISIRKLSGELGVLEPQHLTARTGFEMTYTLSEQTREMMRQLARYDKFIAKKAAEKKAAEKKAEALKQAAAARKPVAIE